MLEEIKTRDSGSNSRMTITEAAEVIGVVPRTIMRWENSGKIKKARRDWKGWRVYTEEDLMDLKKLHDSIY
ncbi:MerR family transcriptional regulator [Candidatus Omnitrophota bacterium]